MLATKPPRPRFLLAALPLFLFGSTLMRRADQPAPHRYFSAFEMMHRAFCDPDHDSLMPMALQHDVYGNAYIFECNARGFTVVSAGPDGIFGTDDDTRSDR